MKLLLPNNSTLDYLRFTKALGNVSGHYHTLGHAQHGSGVNDVTKNMSLQESMHLTLV